MIFSADEATRNLVLTLLSSISSIVLLFLSKSPGEYILLKRDLISFMIDGFCGFANHCLIFNALRNDANRVNSICPRNLSASLPQYTQGHILTDSMITNKPLYLTNEALKWISPESSSGAEKSKEMR